MTTIDEALDAFLAEQKARLAARTFRNYVDVIEMFRACMNGYGYESLSELERRRWQQAFDAGDERAFTRLFGPEKIPEQLGPFLGWFVIRKVMAGQEFLKACGTVTKKLGTWLAEQGYVGADAAAEMTERGAEAGDELPRAEKLGELLYEQTRTVPTFDPDAIPDDDWIEDQLWIERVEPGTLWFDGGIGPVVVPTKASDLARPGWAVTITLAKIAGTWRIIEVGNVYP
ncbi:MAG: hypothetical protein AMXMBFR46_24220 [Acidimicrobiia bacterium]